MRTSGKIKIVDRYLFSEVLNSFLGGLVFFSMLMLMFQILRMADFLIEGGVPFGQLLEIMTYRVISDLPLGLSVAFLVGVLIVFSRMSSDSETVALKASGHSLIRLARPVFALSVLVSVFALLLNLNWVPWAETAFRKIMLRIGNNKFTSAIQEGTFNRGFSGLLIYTEKANPQNGRMEKVFIFDERSKEQPMTVVSQTGELIRVAGDVGELQGIVLQLQDGSVHQTDLNTSGYNRINFGTYQLLMDFSGVAGGLSVKPKMFSLKELIAKRNAEPVRSPKWLELDTEVWRRFSVALAPMLFVFLGIGFGTTRTRGTRASVIVITVVVMAAYWQLQVSSLYLGGHGTLPAWMAMEIPNLVVLVFAAFFFKKAAW